MGEIKPERSRAMGTLLPGSHHEVLRSVCPRLCGACPSSRRGCCCSPCLRPPLWSSWCHWVRPALRRPHVAYAHAPVVYAHPIDSGLVYPVAEPYVHDATGDVADDASPAAEAYVHDATGDVSDNSSPEAEAYVHDPTGDA